MIGRDEVHLWTQRLDLGADELAGFAALMAEDERAGAEPTVKRRQASLSAPLFE